MPWLQTNEKQHKTNKTNERATLPWNNGDIFDVTFVLEISKASNLVSSENVQDKKSGCIIESQEQNKE